ncbi:hypothetical protein SKa4_00005 [Pseudomonas phage vB_PpuM-SKa-4]
MKNNPQVTRLSALAAAGINVKSGSPVDVVHQHTRTLGNTIEKLSQPRQWAIAHLMNEAADLLVVETGSLQDDYIDYFKGALEKFGVSSPAELTQEKASEFFNWISANWKKGEGPKAEASVETASQFSFVKVSQNGNTYRLEASDTGNFKSVMIWKGGMWTKPGPDEAFKEKEPHRMLGALRTPNGAELATLNLPETPVASMEEMAELFGAMGIEESEIRRFYGGGPEWNDRSVYDGNIPSVSPANLGVNPTYAYTDMHPLRAYEAEDTIRINGLDATLQSIDNGQAVFTVDGVDTTTVPLDNIVVAEGEASVVATAMVSHRVLVTAGHEDLTQYKSLRHDFETVTANHQELSQVKVGPALQTLAKAGNRRALVLAHAGVQRINEGHALLKASIGYGKEAATASVITELADLNNLCGKDQVSAQDVIDSAPVVTHLKQGEFKADMPDVVDSSDFELNDPQAEQASTRKSRFPSRKR